ncbi:MAG TPA: hypothetical protein DCS93_28995 [Microscillaceae bacterium]|nr:hypothetical protein [Microscillaceae bacterium]
MKNLQIKSLTFVFILLAFFSVSCTKKASVNAKSVARGDLATQIAASRLVWKKLKKQWNNNYVYVNTYTSGEGGFTTKTYVTVKGGKVASAYRQLITLEEGTKVTKPKQAITGEKLEKVKTMDEIYTFTSTTVVQKSPKDNYITFKTFDSGLLSAAGYFPKNCADDCYTGYTLEKVSPLK